MSKKRRRTYRHQHLTQRNLHIAPLKHKRSIRFQYAHTLPKSIMKHLRPILIKTPILEPHPRFWTCARKVRRVKHYKIKTRIRKRQMPKITYYIRANLDVTVRIKFMSRYFPHVTKRDMRILLMRSLVLPRRTVPAD